MTHAYPPPLPQAPRAHDWSGWNENHDDQEPDPGPALVRGQRSNKQTYEDFWVNLPGFFSNQNGDRAT